MIPQKFTIANHVNVQKTDYSYKVWHSLLYHFCSFTFSVFLTILSAGCEPFSEGNPLLLQRNYNIHARATHPAVLAPELFPFYLQRPQGLSGRLPPLELHLQGLLSLHGSDPVSAFSIYLKRLQKGMSQRSECLLLQIRTAYFHSSRPLRTWWRNRGPGMGKVSVLQWKPY